MDAFSPLTNLKGTAIFGYYLKEISKKITTTLSRS